MWPDDLQQKDIRHMQQTDITVATVGVLLGADSTETVRLGHDATPCSIDSMLTASGCPWPRPRNRRWPMEPQAPGVLPFDDDGSDEHLSLFLKYLDTPSG